MSFFWQYTRVSYTSNGMQPDFDAGESYLELSHPEEALPEKVCAAFDRVIVIINSSNSMELGWVDAGGVDAALLVPAAGAKGFAAIGKVLSGEGNPSGRTADTFVYDLLTTPTAANVALHFYDNTRSIAEEILREDATCQGVVSFVNYAEGIYTGYKFYETAADDAAPVMGARNGLVLADMTGLTADAPPWESLLDQLIRKDMETPVNRGGWSTAEIAPIDKMKTSDSDGPAGLNNCMTGASGTTYPSEVLMAQSWDKALAYEIGVSMGEDAVLSGHMAAQQIAGATQFGLYPYVKPFALNDQALNRTAMLLTWADEQTMRENCLRAFELAGYDGKVIGIMSAYNWLDTEPACASRALLNGVLREEWGFAGMAITDYDGSYGYMISDHVLRSGGGTADPLPCGVRQAAVAPQGRCRTAVRQRPRGQALSRSSCPIPG